MIFHFEGVIALKSSCNVHLLHISFVHFIAHFIAHFRYFGNHFRECGSRNSLFAYTCRTFAIGK